jgi:hypothetical protein
MRKGEAPDRQPSRQTGDHDAGERPDDGEAGASPSPSEDGITSSGDATDNELLCTICGLRACWQ